MSQSKAFTPLQSEFLRGKEAASIQAELTALDRELDKILREHYKLLTEEKVSQVKNDMQKWILDQK